MNFEIINKFKMIDKKINCNYIIQLNDIIKNNTYIDTIIQLFNYDIIIENNYVFIKNEEINHKKNILCEIIEFFSNYIIYYIILKTNIQLLKIMLYFGFDFDKNFKNIDYFFLKFQD